MNQQEKKDQLNWSRKRLNEQVKEKKLNDQLRKTISRRIESNAYLSKFSVLNGFKNKSEEAEKEYLNAKKIYQNNLDKKLQASLKEKLKIAKRRYQIEKLKFKNEI